MLKNFQEKRETYDDIILGLIRLREVENERTNKPNN